MGGTIWECLGATETLEAFNKMLPDLASVA